MTASKNAAFGRPSPLAQHAVGRAARRDRAHIGYDKASEIVKEAAASGRSLREVARVAGVDESILDEALDYHAIAKPHG